LTLLVLLAAHSTVLTHITFTTQQPVFTSIHKDNYAVKSSPNYLYIIGWNTRRSSADWMDNWLMYSPYNALANVTSQLQSCHQKCAHSLPWSRCSTTLNGTNARIRTVFTGRQRRCNIYSHSTLSIVTNANNCSLFKAACMSQTIGLHAVNDFMHAGVGMAGRCRCSTAVSFAITLQHLRVMLQLTGLSCVANSRAATCAFFTNLARWKFPYEYRLLRESYSRMRWPNPHPHFG